MFFPPFYISHLGGESFVQSSAPEWLVVGLPGELWTLCCLLGLVELIDETWTPQFRSPPSPSMAITFK